METIKKSVHNQLLTFFSDTALATRGFRPTITAKDAQQLKRVMALNIFNQSRMEQLMLYYLADRNYKNLAPSMATMFSGTILNSLRNAVLNREKFYKELEGYASRYIKLGKQEPRCEIESARPTSMAYLIEQLANKMSLNKSAQPRAPMRKVGSKNKPLTLFN